MNFEKLINELARNAAKTALHKKEDSTETISLKDIGSGDILMIILKGLVNNGEYNKAENTLFDAIKSNNSEEIYQIALSFYDLLLEKSDEELKEGNFSREEIYEGIKDVNNLFNSNVVQKSKDIKASEEDINE